MLSNSISSRQKLDKLKQKFNSQILVDLIEDLNLKMYSPNNKIGAPRRKIIKVKTSLNSKPFKHNYVKENSQEFREIVNN